MKKLTQKRHQENIRMLNHYIYMALLPDLDNCKGSGPDFCRFAIKKFAIIDNFFIQ